ncbi:MAG: hypothetical protein ACRECX_01635 [Methyloceanibacter sp.]|uniref:hypothetical protein n=1 Tax=Methyloceanibacter sp. TaxID=1965321 RepID=UPI003D6CAA2A
MRDIRDDLQDRADQLRRQIKAAHVQFEESFEQITKEQGGRLKDLQVELDAVKRLIAVVTWHQNVRAVMARAVAAATAVAQVTEAACRSSHRQAEGHPTPAE